MNREYKNRINKLIEVVFFAILIAFTYVFFRVIHPLIIFDTDDWWYIYYSRKAIPVFGSWNPSRVFPEVLMPLISEITSFTLYPITHDFIGSLATSHALVVAFFIGVYLYSFYRLCRDVFCDSLSISMCCSLLFYMLHFLVFRINDRANMFLLNAHNVTCYYYYIIPVMLNASLVMWMIDRKRFEMIANKTTPLLKGVYILLVYLAIFSNLYSSIIIAAYSMAEMLIGWKEGLKKHTRQILIIIVWIISAVFEMFGGRANDVYDADKPLLIELKKTVELLGQTLSKINRCFLIVTIFSLGIFIYLYIRHRKVGCYFKLILSGIITLLFLILLCAVTGFTRINRPDVLISFFFFFFAFMCVLICTLFADYPRLMIIAPIVLLVVYSEINTEGVTFIEANTPQINSHIAEEISRDIVNQITTANQNGENEIYLYVPKWNTPRNWPHGMYAEDRFSKALFKLGVIDNEMIIHMVPSEEMYREYME